MGTRADFYVGMKDPKWIGSIDKDGFPWNIPCKILIQNSAIMFEELVVEYLMEKKGIVQSMGDSWVWPWEDSRMTDYSYIFANQSGAVYAYSMVEKIVFSPIEIMRGEDLHRARVLIPIKFPKMGVGYGPNAAKAV